MVIYQYAGASVKQEVATQVATATKVGESCIKFFVYNDGTCRSSDCRKFNNIEEMRAHARLLKSSGWSISKN